MSGYEYLYVNGQVNGNPSFNAPATIDIKRLSPILKNTKDVVCSVERFYFHGARLPLFDTSVAQWKIGMRMGGGAISQYVVDWSTLTASHELYEAGTADSGTYLYSYVDFAAGINLAFENLAASLGIAEANRPQFSYDYESRRFILTTSDTFRASYEVVVTQPFQFALNTFDIVADSEAGWFRMDIVGEVTEQTEATLELLSPVMRIALRTRSLPVDYELLQPPSVTGGITDEIGSFLVDYKYTQSNNQSIQSILYSAGDADHRWHNMLTGTNLREFSVSFYWVDYGNVFHEMLLTQSSMAEIKLLFQRKGGVPLSPE